MATCSCILAASPASAALRSPRRRAGAAATAAPPRRPARLAVRAAAQPDPERPAAGGSSMLADLTSRAERVLGRYDFVSAGMGALLVTGFCVARGQDAGTALWITAAATVFACLVNDMLPEEH